MVAAKFEPQENWLPPGFVVKKDSAYQGLNVIIASVKSTKCFRKKSYAEKAMQEQDNNTDVKYVSSDLQKNNLVQSSQVTQTSEASKFEQELEALTEVVSTPEETDVVNGKTPVPYNLQTQHSLPDKSIADCVEALIGCYLVTCSQKAALLFMNWLGLKVFPDLRDDCDCLTDTDCHKLSPPPSPLLTHVVPNAQAVLNHYLNGYETFEEKIQYKFKDKSYLLQAFTHASYHYHRVTDCYQRLEFLGDAILDYVITRHLFEDQRKHSPGILTDLRSALVNNNIFAALAVKWDFHKFFKQLSPELFIVINKFVAFQKERKDEIDVEEFDMEDVGDDNDEDVEIPKALGDIFESVAGAIYLDSGMSLDVVWKVYYRLMKPQIDAYTEKIPKSPVRELLELEPETAKFEKPEKTCSGKIRVTVNVVGKGRYSGIGRNYRIAKSAAAKRALKAIKYIEQQIAAHHAAMIPKFLQNQYAQ